MYKAHQVLVGIPEAHAAAYATLKETGRTREVEGDHALVLVPNVNHTIQPLVAAFHGKLVQQAVPHPAQLVESGIHGLYGRKTGYQLVGFLLVDKRHIAILGGDDFPHLFTLNIF